ncbi:MAG TPA: winged helix-turn-helix domain-containing protein [Paracoccus solventivorans]|uniref:Winged helix-turn-helix domain-containing protein n=1 Tax=Paracoccus solventivorans TaxID=53463 RepID=A0A832PKE1_9RHOB|nr:winged helix-turn-helix domain-containing protein [Paracoccus solventivorans]
MLIRRLRRKIEADPTQPEFILTRMGEGYCFAAPASPGLYQPS